MKININKQEQQAVVELINAVVKEVGLEDEGKNAEICLKLNKKIKSCEEELELTNEEDQQLVDVIHLGTRIVGQKELGFYASNGAQVINKINDAMIDE